MNIKRWQLCFLQRTQHGPHGRGLRLCPFQWQGDQLIVAFRHGVEHQVLQNAQLARAHQQMAVQTSGRERVYAGCIQPYELYRQIGQPCNRVWCKACEIIGCCAQVRTSTRGGRSGVMAWAMCAHSMSGAQPIAWMTRQRPR